MEKLKMQTKNLADENFKKLSALFPNAVTETITGYDEDGKAIIERAIDADVLRQEISAQVVEGKEERYQFTWPDKNKHLALANIPCDGTLRLIREKSVGISGKKGEINSQNIYIEGDNLEAIKLLREAYLGKIKVIYIDPPYNTGNDFVYNDYFTQSESDYLDNSGQYDYSGNMLVQNTESNGRFHTDWLNMIYPRLKIAKDLLSEDGVLFISIDDNEIDNLTKCCKELFGYNNIIATFVVASNSAKNNSKFVSVTHEYLICIAKNINDTPHEWAVSKQNSVEFIKITKQLLDKGLSADEMHQELLNLVKYPKYYEFDHYTYVDKRGPFRASDLTAPGSKAKYDVLHPLTKKACKTGTRGWAYSEKEMERLIENDYILFGKDESVMPQLKNYLYDNEKSLPKSVLFFDSQASTKWMKAQKFGFDYPKSIDYMKYILSMYPNDDYIVMDFFSGSATTAHAVMQLNAEDSGNRRFILVQFPEPTPKDSESYKNGYNNICEIGEQRIYRAGQCIKEDMNRETDYGYRVFKIDSSNMKDVYYNPAETQQSLLDIYADNIKPDRTPEDLLFQVMLELGVMLSSKIEETEIAGKKIFNVAEGFLIACFDDDITDETVKAIAQKKPTYAAFRDSGMADDSVATNFDQIFETYSPDTIRKVL